MFQPQQIKGMSDADKRKSREIVLIDFLITGKKLPERLFESEIKERVQLLNKDELYIYGK